MAAYIYRSCIKRQELKNKNNTAQRERWQMLGGYLWIMLTNNRHMLVRNEAFGRDAVFPYREIIGSAKNLSQDKLGANISLLALRTLFLIMQKKQGELEQNSVSLKNYLSYHKDSNYKRSRLYVNMLIALGEGDYKHYKNAAKLNRLEAALAKTEPIRTAAAMQQEVLSYDIQWKMIKKLTGAVSRV